MTEECPSYFTGRREHIHALGVISLSYSAFERDLFTLYAHHPGVKSMPRELVEKYWSSQNEASQVKSVREIFQMCETDAAPLAFVNKLMDYFDWCSHTKAKIEKGRHVCRPDFIRDEVIEVRLVSLLSPGAIHLWRVRPCHRTPRNCARPQNGKTQERRN